MRTLFSFGKTGWNDGMSFIWYQHTAVELHFVTMYTPDKPTESRRTEFYG